MIVTLKYRVKDARAAKRLREHARAVNQVWNYCCQIQREAEARWKAGRRVRCPTAFDLINLTSGSSALLGVHADTINEVCRQFARSRDQAKKRLRFRASYGAKRALGWIPHRGLRSARIDGDTITYLKRRYRLWLSRPIEGEIKTGAFVEDARGRWYATFQCEVAEDRPTGNGEVGIDLGLKAVATLSDGTTIPALQHYRKYEAALATAQRAKSKRRVQAIHAKIANARRHHLHEWSTKIARENSLIVVGNVSAAKLAKTKMAKSVLDAGWSAFRHMLRYKAARRQEVYVEADERWTSATCSECGALSGPKGIAGLRIRHWECPDCGASHDRDVNAAQNILRVGRERPPLVAEIRAA